MLQTKALSLPVTPLIQKENDEEEEVQRQPEEEEKKLRWQADKKEEELRKQPEEEKEKIQAKGEVLDDQATPELVENRIHASGGGRALPEAVRDFFEPHFGYDFSGVRVHADSDSAAMARSIQAQAFTHGRDIYFGTGAYHPGTSDGKQLLAHELTHVVQQGTMLQPMPPNRVQRQTISDCRNNGERQAVVNAALLATMDLNASIALLTVRPLSPRVRAALFLAFRSDSDATADTVKTSLEEVRNELPTDGFVCRRQGDWLYGAHCSGNTAAFTPHASAYLGIMGVTICIPQYLGMTLENQAAAIIHEGTHRHQQTSDNGYFSGPQHLESPETAGDSPATRLDNADSFSSFVYYFIHSNAGDIQARAEAYRGANLMLNQVQAGPINLSGNDPRIPLFEVTGIPANSGYRYRWVIDANGERLKMMSDQGQVFTWCSATRAYINTPTRERLRAAGYSAARVLCRVQLWRGAQSNDPTGTVLLELPVTFV